MGGTEFGIRNLEFGMRIRIPNSKFLILNSLTALIAALLLSAACSSRPPEDKNYAAKVSADRVNKDASFEKSSDSPIPAEKRGEFLPLAYFPVDPDYNVPAVLRPTDDRTTWLVLTRWKDEDSFNAWISSPAFMQGHAHAGGDGEKRAPVAVSSELWSYEVAQ